MRFSGFVSFLLLASYALPSMAVEWSAAEMKIMPPYCEARLKRVPGQFEHWNKILGPDFIHTHHYCHSLGYINRYYSARSQQEKKWNLQEALNQASYVVSHAQPTYSLMPEVYLNRGLVLSLMGNYGVAIGDLKKALELNPRLVKAYALTSDIHAKLKQKGEALTVVAEGLRHVPDSSVLQRLYKERGGKLPYPAPIAGAAEVPAVQVQTPRENAVADEESKPRDAQLAPTSPAPSVEEGDGGRAVTQAPAPPKIGSPTNPWCRFCPDPAQ